MTEAMAEIFSRVGVPKEILSDQGTNFVGFMSTTEHTEVKYSSVSSSSNGIFRRFNGTLKRMFQIYAQAKSGKWDKLLLHFLFAYREVLQESTGFASSELMYGRHISGPLAILRENIYCKEDESQHLQPSVLSYIIEMLEKLANMADLV